jgi:hypothetical protein
MVLSDTRESDVFYKKYAKLGLWARIKKIPVDNIDSYFGPFVGLYFSFWRTKFFFSVNICCY